jgi:hypothetical protein
MRSPQRGTRAAGLALLFGAAALANAVKADTVIGDFEGTSDNWIDWSTQSSYAGSPNPNVLPSPKYSFSNTGATLGSQSLHLTQTGYQQTLAVKLEYIPGAMAAFFANNTFSIDVTLPAATGSGFSQFYQVALNAPGWGFKDLTANPVPNAQWGWGASGGPAQTHTVSIDYSQALASIPSNAGYAEFIIATNNGGAGAPNEYFFDNARLSLTPEPASTLLFSAAGFAGAARRRRKV